jgi:pimeloyl-ACP methyl ester carboxylesterase
MNKYILFSAVGIMLLLTACFRLDDNLFNPLRIDEYLLDDYDGEQDFVLANGYDIPDSYIKEITLNSKAPSERNPTKIYGIYIGDIEKIAEQEVIMYCHGNKWHMDFYWQRAKLLANIDRRVSEGQTYPAQHGVLMIDYRGYGKSEGKSTEEGLYADVDAALQWLKERGLTNDRLIMYGFSLGSAPATEITANPERFSMNPSKLILEAPFASSAVMVQDAAKMAFPSSFYTNIKIDNAEEIKKVNTPFLWIHGIEDDFLSMVTHGEVVYKNYGGPENKKVGIRVPEAGHGGVPSKLGFRFYKDSVVGNFLKNKKIPFE